MFGDTFAVTTVIDSAACAGGLGATPMGGSTRTRCLRSIAQLPGSSGCSGVQVDSTKEKTAFPALANVGASVAAYFGEIRARALHSDFRTERFLRSLALAVRRRPLRAVLIATSFV